MSISSIERRLGLEILQMPELAMGQSGQAGRFGPDDVWWRLGRERALLAGGPCALLLQVAHPLVAAGVFDHSDFVSNPMARLRSTMAAVLTVTFGDTDQADAVSKRVGRRHAVVRGRLSSDVGRFPAGTAYDATDPQLAKWILATLVWTSQTTANSLLGPMTDIERSQHVAESVRFGALFGVDVNDWPGDWNEFSNYFDDVVRNTLCVGSQGSKIADDIFGVSYTGLLRFSPPLVRAVTAQLLPPVVAKQFDLKPGGFRKVTMAVFRRVMMTTLLVLPQSLRFWPHASVANERLSSR